MRVVDLMQRDVKTIEADAPVTELVQMLADYHVSGLPVVTTGGRLVGVVSATDVLRANADEDDAEARARMFDEMTVRDLMTRDPHVIALDADVREAAQTMLYADVRRLFVKDGDSLVGVISQTDIAHAFGTARL